MVFAANGNDGLFFRRRGVLGLLLCNASTLNTRWAARGAATTGQRYRGYHSDRVARHHPKRKIKHDAREKWPVIGVAMKISHPTADCSMPAGDNEQELAQCNAMNQADTIRSACNDNLYM